MMQSKPLLCIHGHFYQPPRDDPFTGRFRKEVTAAPYNNWNERITAECYHPNALSGNFKRISFNLGGTLAKWMDQVRPDTYARIITDSKQIYSTHGAGNGIAQSVHHTILPLARGRDKRCQITWGISSFIYRFGYQPSGIWLPELAVDYETLEIVSEAGLSFVILSDEQVIGDLSFGAGPYTVRLSGNSKINVFIRNRWASNVLAFQMPKPKDAKDWIRGILHNHNPHGLTLLAADGETFGHHHHEGVKVLEELTRIYPDDDYEVVSLGTYLTSVPSGPEIEIHENSAWSCSHNLARWATGCACTPGQSYWKGALRRAFENLSRDIDEIYADVLGRHDVSPWRIRDDYIHVILGAFDSDTLMKKYFLQHRSHVIQQRILHLLQAQLHRQRMFTSCAFFFEDLDRIETRYAIANAVQAMSLVYCATGDDLIRAFRRDLSIAQSTRTGRTGAQILDELLARANFGESALGGEMVALEEKEHHKKNSAFA
jgi:alpha-amylase/alpha-mannosidase (GH57 family)